MSGRGSAQELLLPSSPSAQDEELYEPTMKRTTSTKRRLSDALRARVQSGLVDPDDKLDAVKQAVIWARKGKAGSCKYTLGDPALIHASIDVECTKVRVEATIESLLQEIGLTKEAVVVTAEKQEDDEEAKRWRVRFVGEVGPAGLRRNKLMSLLRPRNKYGKWRQVDIVCIDGKARTLNLEESKDIAVPQPIGTKEQFYYYCLSKRLQWLGLSKWLFLVLTIFMEASICRGPACEFCDAKLYSFGLPYIPLSVSASISILLWIAIFVRMFLRRKALGPGYDFNMWQKLSMFVTIIGVVASITSLVLPVFQYIDLFCRPVVLLSTTKRLRKVFEEVAAVVPMILDVLVSVAISMLVFLWIGMVIFAGTTEGIADFSTWRMGLGWLWVTYTANGTPDVFLAAYRKNKFYVIYFVIFLILSLYILTNVLLATIFSSYKAVKKEELKTFQKNRRTAIAMAYSYLVDMDKSGNSGNISKAKWEEFFVQYCDPVIGEVKVGDATDMAYNKQRCAQILENTYDIDVERKRGINLKKFQAILEAWYDKPLYIPGKQKKEEGGKKGPQRKALYVSAEAQQTFYKLLNDFFVHGIELGGPFAGRRLIWDRVMDAIIFVGMILTFVVSLDYTKSEQPLQQYGSFWALFVFSCIYVLGISLKICMLGLERFWYKKPLQHRFDLANVWSLFLFELLYLIVFPNNRGLERAILILHIARGLRLLAYIDFLQQLYLIIVRVVPELIDLLTLLFVVYYIFAITGIYLFGGLIYSTNPALAGGDFLTSDYLALNFNDFPSSMVTLFCFMVLDDWGALVEGFIATSGTVYACIFFLLFFLACNLLALHVVMSLVLDATANLQDEIREALQKQKEMQQSQAKVLAALGQDDYGADDDNESRGNIMSKILGADEDSGSDSESESESSSFGSDSAKEDEEEEASLSGGSPSPDSDAGDRSERSDADGSSSRDPFPMKPTRTVI